MVGGEGMKARVVKTQRTTAEIRQLLTNANMDYDSVVNKALNAYLPHLFLCCPFTDELCLHNKQCMGCETHLKIAQVYEAPTIEEGAVAAPNTARLGFPPLPDPAFSSATPFYPFTPAPSSSKRRNSFAACALYVGVVVCGTPQEWLRTAMLFGEATCFSC